MLDLTIQETPIHESYAKIDKGHIELLAERLIRKHLLAQHVDKDHPVYKTEERLVREATVTLMQDIDSLGLAPQSLQLVKMTVFLRVRTMIRQMVRLHDIDDELADDTALLSRKEALAILMEPRES